MKWDQKNWPSFQCFSSDQSEPEAPPPPSPVGTSRHDDGSPRLWWPAISISVEKERERKNDSVDIKYNRGRRSRKSYRAAMNSFPFDLVPFWFNLLLAANSRPEKLDAPKLHRATPPLWAKHMFCSAGSLVSTPQWSKSSWLQSKTSN